MYIPSSLRIIFFAIAVMHFNEICFGIWFQSLAPFTPVVFFILTFLHVECIVNVTAADGRINAF